MRRTSKDLAKRLRFRRYPGADTFRRYYWLVGLGAILAGLATWAVVQGTLGRRQYLPATVSQNHAIFGDRCESCHTAFEEVYDQACLACHSARIHTANEINTPACAHCHVEHRSTDVFLSVSDRACIECHGDIQTKASAPPIIEPKITRFHDHPEFVPLRATEKDRANIRFNHRLHFTSKDIREQPMTCDKCHKLDGDGLRMQPMQFATHCERCHKQTLASTGGSVEALHTEPVKIREDLRTKLLDTAVTIGVSLCEPMREQLKNLAIADSSLLFPTLLPGRAPRAGFDVGQLSVSTLEADLYRPLKLPEAADQSLFELNQYCFLCHFESGARADAQALPQIAPTDIPDRWLGRSEFSHLRHQLVSCTECHGSVEQSTDTPDVNLPSKALCQRCHIDGARDSAGTQCMLCHLYHDTSKARLALTPVTAHALTLDIACLKDGACPAR